MIIKEFFVEIILRKKTWIIRCPYNPKQSVISEHLQQISSNLDLLSPNYDNIMLIGDFKAEPTETVIYET